MSVFKAAVVGSTRGTGLEIGRLLLSKGDSVVAIARDPEKAKKEVGGAVEAVYGDVTKPQTMEACISGDLNAIFYTVDITGGIGGRGVFGKTEDIRAAVYGGLVNTVVAAKKAGFTGRIVLLNTMGLVIDSGMMKMLDWMKKGLKQASIDKNKYLMNSGLDYCVVHAGVLTNNPGNMKEIIISGEETKLTMSTKICRQDLARVMVACAKQSSMKEGSIHVYWGKGAVDTDETIVSKLAAIGASS